MPSPQPFTLFTHCGILTTYLAGRTFYLAELYPARVQITGNPGSPEVAGTMTLLSPHLAAFVDPAGNRILFVDALPGALGTPYPFGVHVMRGGNRLGDEQDALFRSQAGAVLHYTALPPAGCD